MEIRHKLYPYPVLAEFLPDYKTSRFDVDAQLARDGFSWEIRFEATLTDTHLGELIGEGKACYVYHMECALTGFRTVVETREERCVFRIPDDKVNGTLQICPFIVAAEDITGFTDPDFADDYDGLAFDIETGCVLAVGPYAEADVSNEREDLANVPSIFSIVPDDDPDTGGAPRRMKLDDSGRKIILHLPRREYDTFHSLYRQNDSLKPMLNSLTVIPALVAVLDELKALSDTPDNYSDYAEHAWYRTIRRVLKDDFHCDIETGDLKDQTTIELAQGLINDPLPAALNALSEQKDIEEDNE